MSVVIEHRPDYLYIRMSGEYIDSIPAEGRPASMAKVCRDSNYRCLLVDIRDLAGEIGSGVYFHQGEEITKAFAFNIIRIALVGTVDRMSRLLSLENRVVNQGVVLKVFTDIDEATAWLME
ncbi:MAG: hypothetical protein JXB30_01590 [Anaerolineae bacterium]|nr:hypothetical protein [Anaerolineae bacterium]